jgi:GNAT superfamily N-acetyltransferase
MSEIHPYSIRPARPEDIPSLLALIRELAEFENLGHLVTCTKVDLLSALFDQRCVSAVLLFPQGSAQPAAFAFYFHNFSTFVGRRGLYVEDLYVQETHRGKGFGKALLVHLAQLAVELNCGRFEWVVLDWNTRAQRFYESLGATVLPDWRVVRVTGDGIKRMAAELPAAKKSL